MSKKFATLAGLRKEEHDSGEESDGAGERQGFFVGGSEHSGQQVLGPERPGRGSGSNMAERVFDAAREHGAEALNSSDLSPHPRRSQFGGGGVRLGDHSLASEVAQDGSSSGESDMGEPEEVVVDLLMWENGFSIDDGPLRSFEEPESRQFLESIMEGRVPSELLAAHPRRRIDLRMQRRAGPYQAPKPKPFQGTGVRLGAVVPQIVQSAPPSSSTTPAQGSVDNLAKAQADVNLDNSSPITQVQIRLPDGQRVSGRFNHAHTVSAIRTFLVTAYPDMAATAFQLMTIFPNKVIDDETVDLKDAGLLNAVVVVKLCA